MLLTYACALFALQLIQLPGESRQLQNAFYFSLLIYGSRVY